MQWVYGFVYLDDVDLLYSYYFLDQYEKMQLDVDVSPPAIV